MSRENVAQALDKAAEALAEAAHALRATEPDAARASVPAAEGSAPRPSAPAALPPKRSAPDTSAFTECPAHRKPWTEGRYGPMCTGKGEPEGNWVNDKGYCRVTPKSAGAWLKQHPQGPVELDDVPF